MLLCEFFGVSKSISNDLHISIAIRTAWPPLNHPLSDQPDTSTIKKISLITTLIATVFTHCLYSFMTSNRCEQGCARYFMHLFKHLFIGLTSFPCKYFINN